MPAEAGTQTNTPSSSAAVGQQGREDDGYLVSFIADVENDRSECVLIDAKNIAAGPVCRIILPERICAGTHSVWANGDDIGMGENSVLAA